MATQKQQGIKKRLTKGFTKVAVIGAVAAIIGIGALLIAAAQYEKALNRYGFTQGDIGKAMTAFSESRSALRAVVGYDDEAVIEKQTALHDQKKEAFETYMDELSRTLKFSEGREAYNAVLTELDGYWELDARILELATSDDADGYLEAQELDTTDLTAQYEQIYAEFVELMNLCVQKGDRAEADGDPGNRCGFFLEFGDPGTKNGARHRKAHDSIGRSSADLRTGRFKQRISGVCNGR